MIDKMKTAWNIFSQVVTLCLIGYLVWQGMHLDDRLASHEKQILQVQSSVLTLDANGKQVQEEVQGLAKVMQQPAVYHQYYSSTTQGAAAYTEREKDPATGQTIGPQIKGSMTMGSLDFEWNGKRYAIPSDVAETSWLENGQFKFSINAKNEIKVKQSKTPSLDLVTRAGYGTNAIQEKMRPYGSVELEHRILF